MQEEHARLRGDGDANLVGDLQAAASLEMFLGEEDLDVAEQLLSIGGRQQLGVWHVARDDRPPGVRKRGLADRRAAATPQPAKHRRVGSLPTRRSCR